LGGGKKRRVVGYHELRGGIKGGNYLEGGQMYSPL